METMHIFNHACKPIVYIYFFLINFSIKCIDNLDIIWGTISKADTEKKQTRKLESDVEAPPALSKCQLCIGP